MSVSSVTSIPEISVPESHNGGDFLLTLLVHMALLHVTIIHVPSKMLQIKKRVCIANHRPTLEAWD